MTPDLVDQAFDWLRQPFHVSLLAVGLSVPTLLWRLVAHGTVHDRTPWRDSGEGSSFSISDCGSDGCGDGGTD